MRKSFHCLASFLVAALTATPTFAQNPLRTYSDAFEIRFDQTQPVVRYVVRAMPHTDSLGYHVTMFIRHAPSTLDVAIPVWAPGAYRLGNFHRYVKNLVATADGNSLFVSQRDSSTWRVHTRDGAATIQYDVQYPTVVGARGLGNYVFYRPDGALLGGPMTYLYIVGHTNIPSHVTFDIPATWTLATGLVPTSDARSYFAASYDMLIDCPVLIGAHLHIWSFNVDGVPHRIAYYPQANTEKFDTTRFIDAHRRIVAAAASIMGRLPYREYTFIYEDGPGGGLEHLNSATMGAWSTVLKEDPLGFASLTAHEYFHAWNVKRARPKELGPFAYNRPNRTTLLWWAEGVTDFFADEIVRRTGLRDEHAARHVVASAIESYLNNPGHTRISPERSSYTAWDPNTVNDGYYMSYYTTGALVGEMLDLQIRGATHGARGMDDVERALFARYAGPTGYTYHDIVTTAERVCKCTLAPFFANYVHRAGEIDFNTYLRAAGWRLSIRHVTADSVGHPIPDLRASISAMNGVGSLGGYAGSPARLSLSYPNGTFGRGGLLDGDFIVAINGMHIASPADFVKALRNVQVGDTLHVDYVRGGVTKHNTIPVLPWTYRSVEIVDLPVVTPQQRMVREVWLHGR